MHALKTIDFGFYLALFWRRFPLFLLVTLIAGSAVVAAVSLWPLSYQATARILVESPQIPIDMAKSTVPTSAGEQFQIVRQDVFSRENLLAVADRFAVYGPHSLLSRADMFSDMNRRLQIESTAVDGEANSASSIIGVSFRADRPDVAAEVVNALVAMILARDVQLRTKRASDTVDFFSKERDTLEARLRDVEDRVLAFKTSHLNALPDSLEFRRSEQSAQQLRLLALSQEEAGLLRRATELRTRPLEVTTAGATPEAQQLQNLRQALAAQQVLFSSDSPTIKALQGRIAALESAWTAPATTTSSSAPVASETADINERLSEIVDERSAIKASLADLASSIAETPENEAALNGLQRDLQNLQAQYATAVSRLADATTGRQIEVLLKGERLSVIERAEPPQDPQGPKRKILLLGGVAGAFLLGLLAVVAPEFLNRRVRRPEDMIQSLQIVPYLTVPHIGRTRSARGLAAALALVAALIPAMLLVALPSEGDRLKGIVSWAHLTFSNATFKQP